MDMFKVMNNTDSVLIGGISQTGADATMLNVWNASNLALTNDWLKGTNADWENEFKGYTKESDFQNFLSANSGDLNGWSTQVFLDFQADVVKNDNGDPSWGPVTGALGSLNAAISAAQTEDTQESDTEGKNKLSDLQADNTAGQPIAEFASAWTQTLTSVVNQQASVGPS